MLEQSFFFFTILQKLLSIKCIVLPDQENKSIPFKTIIDRKEFAINFKLKLTMIDVKNFNAITSYLSAHNIVTYVRQLQNSLKTFSN